MKKKILETKGYFDGKNFIVTHIKITKEIACHENNKALKLSVGYVQRSQGCTEEQPSDTPTGYYICSGNQWVFVPFT